MELQQRESRQLQGQQFEHVSSLHNCCPQADHLPKQDFETDLGEIELMDVDQCGVVPQVDDSQLVGALEVAVVKDADVAVGEDACMVDVEVNFPPARKGRRGRPSRGALVKATRQPGPSQRKKKDEEDVCFICFDGGSLVLCDRRGCPKAYHPSCIKRDEAFFRSRAKWNCGWHICNSCEKASVYLCYTCPYSLCKGCTKDADYFCVRGNKGFCGTCMRTIMLVENFSLGNQEKVQVDFDDKSSWEYLFKVYWMYLKGKLCFTSDELIRAKNPWNGPAITTPKGESLGEFNDSYSNKGRNSENTSDNLEANLAKRRKTKKQPEFLYKLNPLNMEKVGGDDKMPLRDPTKWATDELLELVAHMKNGDTAVMSQSEVQDLLLEYIKRNNLCDPHKECQIVCDSRLFSLFGKAQVGHVEMPRLLESHFLNWENSMPVAGRVNVVSVREEADAKDNNHLRMINDNKRTRRKKADKREKFDPEEYAAIDVHNVNLIYLKRSMAENLIVERETFHDKVVGLIVRIKISGSDPKQDTHRLVQVIGTAKTAEPYKVGEMKTDILLETLNLHEKEMFQIDLISNQEFSEDECRLLRQSIKCGLIKHYKVGEIQRKTMALQAQRTDDVLKAEIMRYSHLRDRASEKGHIKKHRECVRKLQVLSSPEERKCRLLTIPEVHADPTMNPSYESEDVGGFDEKIPGNCVRPKNPSSGMKEREPLSPKKVGDVLNDMGSTAQENSVATLEQNMNVSITVYVDRDGNNRVNQTENESQGNQVKESFGLANNQVGLTCSVSGGQNNDAAGRSKSFSGVASGGFLRSSSAAIVQPLTNFETHKIWHYQDPRGKIQGPFSMEQLQKWNTSGHFPTDLRVWRINQKQDDSVLLTDALSGQYQKEPSFYDCLIHQERSNMSDCGAKNCDGERSGSVDATPKDITRVGVSVDSMQNDGNSVHSKANDEVVKGSGLGSQSSSLSISVAADLNKGNSSWPDQQLDATPKDITRVGGSVDSMENDGNSVHSKANDEVVKGNGLGSQSSSLSISVAADLNKGNSSWPDQQSVRNSLLSSTRSQRPCESLSHQVKESQGGELGKSDQSSLNGDSQKITEVQTDIRHCNDRQVESNSGQSSGQNQGPQPLGSSNGWDSKSALASLAKSLEIEDQNQEIDFSDLPCPTPKLSHQHNLDGVLHCTTEDRSDIGQSNDKQVDCEGNSGQSSGQNCRPPAIDCSTSGWHSNSSFVSLGKSLEVSDQNREINFSDLRNVNPKPSHLDLQNQACEVKKSMSSDAPVQDSGPCWSTTANAVAGGLQLTNVAAEWGGYSPTPENPSVEKWESDLTHGSSVKPTEVASDHATTPTSGSCQFTHSSPSRHAANAAGWQPNFMTEEFATLSEESVSDLLAEVEAAEEAIESSKKSGSPTSTLPPGAEATQGSENDCFSDLEVFSPTLDTGGSASLSSNSDLQIHSQSTVTDDTLGVSQTDVFDPQKSYCGRSPASNEAEEDTRHSDDSVIQCEVASDILAPFPPMPNWNMADIDTDWGSGSETTNIGQEGVQGSANLGLGGLAQEITNVDWGTDQLTAHDHVSMTLGTTMGNPSSWTRQPRYDNGGDRLAGLGDLDFNGRDSSFDRGRPDWSRRAVNNDGNRGGSFGTPAKGQRVCKYNEAGYCKRGASCSFWHNPTR